MPRLLTTAAAAAAAALVTGYSHMLLPIPPYTGENNEDRTNASEPALPRLHLLSSPVASLPSLLPWAALASASARG